MKKGHFTKEGEKEKMKSLKSLKKLIRLIILVIIIQVMVLAGAQEAAAQKVGQKDTTVSINKKQYPWMYLNNRDTIIIGQDTIPPGKAQMQIMWLYNFATSILNFPSSYPVRTTSTDSIRVELLASQMDSLKEVMREMKLYLDSIYTKTDVLSLPVVRTENTDTLRVERLNELSIKKFAFRDTTSVDQDTLSRRCFWGGNVTATSDTFNYMASLGFTKWFQVIITSDDSIEVTSSTFPNALSDRWMLYPAESWTSEKFDISATNNLIWKILGTGTASVRVRVWGY